MLATLRHIAGHPLNRGAEIGAFARYLRWQVGSRLVPGPVVVDYLGCKLIARRGGNATGHIYSGLHYFNDMAFAFHLLRPGDVFADVGANIGTYSLPAAARGAKVISFEPGEAYEELAANIRLNGFDIDARREAVGAEPGTLSFTIGMDTVNRAAVDGEASRTVQMTTLDQAAPGAFLIKVDVEGFEAAVVAGGERVFSKAQAVIMELNGQGPRYGFAEADLEARMAGFGFTRVGYDPMSRTLVEPNPNENAMLVRDVAMVAQRLRTADPIHVLGRAI